MPSHCGKPKAAPAEPFSARVAKVLRLLPKATSRGTSPAIFRSAGGRRLRPHEKYLACKLQVRTRAHAVIAAANQGCCSRAPSASRACRPIGRFFRASRWRRCQQPGDPRRQTGADSHRLLVVEARRWPRASRFPRRGCLATSMLPASGCAAANAFCRVRKASFTMAWPGWGGLDGHFWQGGTSFGSERRNACIGASWPMPASPRPAWTASVSSAGPVRCRPAAGMRDPIVSKYWASAAAGMPYCLSGRCDWS